MDAKELKLNTKKKLDEIDQQIKMLNEKYLAGSEKSEEAKKVLDNLVKLRDHIDHLYQQIDSGENYKDTDLNEMDKNIYNSISSYDSAFKNAGSIFRIH